MADNKNSGKNSEFVHTTPNAEGGWDNQKEGQKIDHYGTKAEAVEAGRKEAKKDEVEHIIHNRDGKISESNSYGSDPFPPKG